MKLLYGLKDASRKFWLRMKHILKEQGLETVKGDEAFYHKSKGDGSLEGMVMTHIDNFLLARTPEFLDSLETEVGKVLNVSKVERDKFRFTGIDVEKYEDRIRISMEDYAESIQGVYEIRTGSMTEEMGEQSLQKIHWKTELAGGKL